ncbi:MAG: hypothetical protein O6951_08960 [Actinobacteria bacterium]|nr:hypothetical protein [Actinomycetota bacterium]
MTQIERVRHGGSWARGGKKRQFVVAVVLGAVLAIISWQVGILDGSSNIFGSLQELLQMRVSRVPQVFQVTPGVI